MALSETGDNGISMNGSSVDAVRSVSGNVDENNNLVITVNGVSGSGIPLPKTVSTIKLTGWGNTESGEIQVGLSFTSLGSVSYKPIIWPMAYIFNENDSRYGCGQYSISVVENTTGNNITSAVARNLDKNVKKATGLTLNIPSFDVNRVYIEDGSYKMKVLSLISGDYYIGLYPTNFKTIINECPDITFTVSNGTAHFNALNASVPDNYYVSESINSPGNYSLSMGILFDMITKA